MLRKIANKISKEFVYFSMHGPLGKPTKRETELIEKLRSELKEYVVFSKANAEDLWIKNVNELLELIRTKDPRRFLRWNVIRRTMFVDCAPYIKEEYNYLRKNDWNTWKQVIRETKVGCPYPFLLYPMTSENSIHHAYHLARFQNQIEEKIADADLVFEFGGGYGCMCRLIHKMGFKGKYVILDLPVVSALQVLFLKMTGLDAELELNARSNGISCVSERSQIERLLQNATSKRSIFIATWSISEAPIEKRKSVLNLVKSFDSFLIAYQKSFGEADNIAFFNNWTKDLSNVQWYKCEISHIPNNYYLFGRKRRNHEKLINHLNTQVPNKRYFQHKS